MRPPTITLLAVLICAGCSKSTVPSLPPSNSPPRSREEQSAQLRRQLKTVTVADGISKSEAEIMAECYFLRNVGCGGFTGIRDGGKFWIVDGAFGYAGTPIVGFHIDKATGKITSPIGPSYASPSEIFSEDKL